MKKTLIAFFLSSIGSACFAENSLTISPLPFSMQPTSILNGHQATAYYLVTNNSGKNLNGNYVRYLPPNVTQINKNPVFLNTCSTIFALPYVGNNSCILQLSITGSVNRNDPDPTHHLSICNQEDCSSVDNNVDELNIVVGKSNKLASVVIVDTPNPIAYEPVAYTTTDGGIGWIPHAINGATGTINAITCQGNNNQYCVAVGGTGAASIKDSEKFFAYTSIDGGTTWESHLIDGAVGSVGSISGLNCSDNGQNCVAVGSTGLGALNPAVFVSSDGGKNWTSNFPANKNKKDGSALRAVSCNGTDNQYCSAIGDYYGGYENSNNYTVFIAYTSNDGGNSWAAHPLDKFIGPSLLNSITCNGPNGANCIAVGYLAPKDINSTSQPIIYTTTDAWNTWSYQTPSIKGAPQNGAILKSVICSHNNNQNCTAVGYSLLTDQEPPDPILSYTTTDGGITWTAKNMAGYSILSAMTCSNTQNEYCTAIGYSSNNGDILPMVYGSLNKKNNEIFLENLRPAMENNLTNEDNPSQSIVPQGLSICSTG